MNFHSLSHEDIVVLHLHDIFSIIRKIFNGCMSNGRVTYRFSYAGAITNNILKFKKVIEFESSCIAISLSYIYLMVDRKDHLSTNKEVKDLRI